MDLQSGSTITIKTLTYEVFYLKKMINFYNVPYLSLLGTNEPISYS